MRSPISFSILFLGFFFGCAISCTSNQQCIDLWGKSSLKWTTCCQDSISSYFTLFQCIDVSTKSSTYVSENCLKRGEDHCSKCSSTQSCCTQTTKASASSGSYSSSASVVTGQCMPRGAANTGYSGSYSN